MKRVLRALMIGLWFGLFSVGWAPSWADAGKEIRTYRLLILDSQLGNPYDEIRGALLKTLEEYGYVPGKNLRINLQVSGNDVKKGEAVLRQELGQGHYDVVLVGGTAATISAKNVLHGDRRQAVVFAAPTDPVGIGVIKDFTSKPVANFTGICYPVPVTARLRFIRQLMPQARSFGFVYADMPQSHSYVQWLKEQLEKNPEFGNIQVVFRKVPLVTGEHGDQQMAEAAEKHVRELDASVDAFIKPVDQMGTRRNFSEMVYRAASKPLIGLVKDDVMARWGATAVVYAAHASIGKQAARMIRDLFEGKAVAEILPEWPREYGFAVDLAKARQFGLNVPVEVLQMAGENIIK
ncbi:MAG: ABC transporter substrate binding protein [Sterolibacterium sp.]